MIEFVLLLAVIALAVALRSAFTRIERLEREVRGVRGVRDVQQVREVPKVRDVQEVREAPEMTKEPPLSAPAAPRVPPAPRAPLVPPVPPAPQSESLETRIGARWLLYVGVVAIVVGVAYFEKLAFENQWIGETARVVQGAVAGLALMYAGIRFVRAGYAVYGQIICGAGSAILYVSTYAAFNFYHLIGRPLAFALMVGITGITAALAERQQSQGLAVFAVGGGFATPFLLPGTTDAEIALFGYDAILIAGTVVLSRVRNWPVLNILSYVCTLLTVFAWADRFYTPEKYLPTELFLTLFCGMFLYILRECRRSQEGDAQLAAIFLWTAPFAYYVSSLTILIPHPTAMLVWLTALMLAAGILTVSWSAIAGLGIWLSVALPLLLWIGGHTGRTWIAPGLVTVSAVYLIALIANLYSVWERGKFGGVQVAWLHLNGLVMFAGAYVLVDAVSSATTPALAAGFALWQTALAGITVRHARELALHFGALAFTLAAIAIALQFDGAAVTAAWAAEGVAVITLGLHERRTWLRNGGLALFTIAICRTLSMLAGSARIDQIVLLNARSACAFFVIALSYTIAWLHHRDREAGQRTALVAAALIAAQIVTFALLTSEIRLYWDAHGSALARELMLSVGWALFATVLITIGLLRKYAPIRYFAIVVFALTISKVFFVDLSHLERVYRVLSVIGLGIALLLTSYLYQRARQRAEY